MKLRLYSTLVITSLFVVVYSCKQPATDKKQQFISLENIDSTVRPGDDFFLYANGRWLNKATIPATESSM